MPTSGCELSGRMDLSNALIPVEQLEKKRWVANARERNRVRAMRSAYERLNALLPHNPAEPQLTHVEIVYRALNRIRQLEKKRMENLRQLTDSQPSAQPLYHYTSDCSTPSPASSSTSEVSYDNEDRIANADDAILERPLFKPHRVAINSKMRVRSREMRDAFEALRNIVPFDEAEPYLNQCNLIRRASQYIRYLATLLQTQQVVEQHKESHDKDEIFLQTLDLSVHPQLCLPLTS